MRRPLPREAGRALETWHHVETSLWPCDLRTDRSGSQCEAFVRGAIDAVSARTLARRLAALMSRGVTSITLDLDRVILFDVAGARVIATTAHSLEAVGGRLRLRHPSAAVHSVLTATGLGRLICAEP